MAVEQLVNTPQAVAPKQIGDLYRLKLKQAELFSQMSKDRQHTQLMRDDFRERAWGFESDATCLAHCQALFGDLELSQLDIAELRSQAAHRTCEGQNPWLGGLTIMEPYATRKPAW